MAQILTLDRIKDLYMADPDEPPIGRHWFDRDTMRFWRTVLPRYGYQGPGGIYFASLDRAHDDTMVASVRRLDGPGQISRIETLPPGATLEDASRRAESLAGFGAAAAP